MEDEQQEHQQQQSNIDDQGVAHYWGGKGFPKKDKSIVRRVVVEEGVTSIAVSAFAECFKLRSV